MDIEAWLTAAVEDAKRRGLPELAPLLETMARSTAALRRADATLRQGGDAGTAPAHPERA
jgi:hypothetical protein